MELQAPRGRRHEAVRRPGQALRTGAIGILLFLLVVPGVQGLQASHGPHAATGTALTPGPSPLRAVVPPLPPLAPAAPGVPPGWSHLTGPGPPGARTDAALAFDPVLGVAILFGGWATGPLNDTWQYHDGTWTKLVLTPSPSPRSGASIAWDARGGYLLLFGGTGPSGFLGDSWAFQGGHWISLTVSVHPSARADAGMAIDPGSGRLLLFGGTNGQPLGDTWSFGAGVWSPLSPLVAPPARSAPAMVADPESASVVVFGGLGATPLNDTWEFHAGSWTPLTTLGAPAPRSGSSAVFDPTDGYLVLFGGNGTVAYSDSWGFRASQWFPLLPPKHPPARVAGAAAFDPTEGLVIVFGGKANRTLLDDAWGYRAAPAGAAPYGWTEVHSALEPTDRTQAGFAFDAADGYVVMFGGQNQSGASNATDYYNDTWTYRGGAWISQTVGPSPSPRRGAMMAYDPSEGAVILFGGSNGSAYFNDTWMFRHGSWSQLATPVAPSPRRSAGFAFDPELGGLLLYGGHNGTGGRNGYYFVFNDTWLWRAGAWSLLAPGGGPGPRAEPMLAYDPTDGYAVLFGGYRQNGSALDEQELSSTWAFEHGVWSNISASVGSTPSPRDGAGFVFDPAIGSLLLFAGDNNSRFPLSTIWAFEGGHWTLVCTPCISPTWAADHATYDEADGYLVVQGSNHAGPPASGVPRPSAAAPWLLRAVGEQRTWAWTAAPFLNASPSTPAIDVGLAVQFGAWYGGGTPPWNVSWTYGRSGTAVGPGFGVTPNTTGPFSATATAITRGGNSTPVSSVTVQVNAAPVPSLAFTPSPVAAGAALTYTVGAANGTGPIVLNLTGLPSPCPSSTNRSGRCFPGTTGTYPVFLTATDAFGVTGRTNATLVVKAGGSSPPKSGSSFTTLETYLALFGPSVVAIPVAVYLIVRFRRQHPRSRSAGTWPRDPPPPPPRA